MYGRQIEALDAEMEAMYEHMEPPDKDTPTTTPPSAKRTKRRKDQAHFDLATSLYQMAGVDLTQIDGVDALTAQIVLT